MIYVLYMLHVIVCLFLILVVLLQQGKGADLSVFGGGTTQAAFGARGATTLLHKLTVGFFVLFMVTTLSIGVLQRGRSAPRSCMESRARRNHPRRRPPRAAGRRAAARPGARSRPRPRPTREPGAGAPASDAPAAAGRERQRRPAARRRRRATRAADGAATRPQAASRPDKTGASR